MLRNVVLASVLPLFAAAASAQCATLTTTSSNNTVSINLDGSAPMAIAWLVVGDTAGSTPVNLGPLGMFTIDLALPFVPLPLGLTDMNGDVNRMFTVPAMLPLTTVYAQGITLSFQLPIPPFNGFPNLMFDICVSNSTSFTIGT